MPDNLVYIAIGQFDYEGIDILGVFTDYGEALQRCRDMDAKTPEYEWPRYDRYWVHTWKLSAPEESDTHMLSSNELAYKHV